VQFPMMKAKRNCGVGLVFPSKSQNIPEMAKATPSRNSCSCQNPSEVSASEWPHASQHERFTLQHRTDCQ
jgi:hypothetical protein